MDKVIRYIPTDRSDESTLQDKVLRPYRAGFIVANVLKPNGINTKVIVEDTGITLEFTGKPKDDLERIVNQFFQDEYSP